MEMQQIYKEGVIRMTDIGAIMHCHDAKKDANSFDNLMNEFKSIKRDKKIIQDMDYK